MIFQSATTTEPYHYVYALDPALDHEAKDFLEEYQAALDNADYSRLPVKDGKKPAIWKLRHLSGLGRKRVVDMLQSQSEQRREHAFELAARIALVGVEGAYDDRGRELRITRWRDPELGVDLITEDLVHVLCQADDGRLLAALGCAAITAIHPKKNS